MFERAPNGFFVRDLIVFNLLRRGGYVAKGFVFEAPDLTNSPVADLNDFQDQLCLLLASLHEHQRLQVQYFCDSDYKGELLRYQQETEKFSNVWTKRARNERFTRYWQAMSERKLRRQRVIFYISRSLENVPKSFQTAAARRDYYNTLLDQLETEFEHVHRLLLEIFGSGGARILPMSDLDHFRHYKRFLNPSLNDRFDFDPAEGFSPELSIQENCWHSEGSGQSDFGFFLDGHYHSLIVLTRWPRTTYPGIIQRLTNLRLLDYTITVNVDPLPITQEINKEEKEHDRVAGDYASEKKISLLTVMEKKQKKIHALMQGQTIPFHAMFAIRVWDKTRDGLNAKAGAIKNAINSMNAAQYFESNLPSTSKNLFFQTWPGWTWGRYEHRKLYCRAPLPGGHAAGHEHVHRTPGDRRGDLRRAGQQPGRHPDLLRRQGLRLPAARGVARHVRRGEIRDRLRPAYADRRLLRLHRHHRGGAELRHLHRDGRGRRAAHHHPPGRRPDHQLPRHEGAAADARPSVRRDRARGADDWHEQRRRTNRCSGRRKSPSISTCFTRIRFRTGRRSGTTSCSTSPGTRWRCRSFAPNECRPVRPASKPSPTSATGEPANADRGGRAYLASVRRGRGVEVPERPEDQQGSPQSRLRPLHAGRVPDASDASGVDDARPDGRGARPDHGNRHAHPAVVSRRQLRLPVRRHEQSVAHRAKSRTSSWATSRSRRRN